MSKGQVGSTRVGLSSIGLGSDMFGVRLDETEAFRILDYALEKGITYVDTAEWYVWRHVRAVYRELDAPEEMPRPGYSPNQVLPAQRHHLG